MTTFDKPGRKEAIIRLERTSDNWAHNPKVAAAGISRSEFVPNLVPDSAETTAANQTEP